MTTEAAKEGVAINAGPEWSIGDEADYQMRLCFGYPDEAVIKDGVVEKWWQEPGINNDGEDDDPYVESTPEKCLEYLKQDPLVLTNEV